jgi:hypothetical protein
MWEIEYLDEVKFYFTDNGTYTGNLLDEIERLRYSPDALPPDSYSELEPGLFVWEILNHLVFYRREKAWLLIAAVKPL